MNREKEIRKKFFASIKCGTGGAFLLQKEHPNIDFSKEITKAALRNYAYDGQCEGSRAKYIFKILKKSKKRDEIETAILQKLRTKKNGFWSLVQLCRLAVLLHKSENSKAKDVLVNRFEKSLYPKFEFCGQAEVMEIEGVKGVLRVANVIGRQLRQNPDDYAESWILDRFQKKNPDVDIYSILKAKSKSNRNIKAYYESVLENPVRKFERKGKRLTNTYETVKSKIDSGDFWYISDVGASDLSKKEVKRLADDLLKERDIEKKKSYLKFFRKRKFPYDNDFLLKFADTKEISESDLTELAISALQLFKSKKLRKFALKKIRTDESPEIFLPLFVKNYKKGDEKLFLNIFKRSKKQEFIHSVACDLIDIYKSNKTKKCKNILEQIYHTMRCSIHREDALNLLLENNILTSRMRKEMKYDCNSSVRKMS